VICDVFQYIKQFKSSFKTNNQVSTNQVLQLLHMHLFGPMHVSSLDGNRFVFVIVDDYTKFTRVLFLTRKDKKLQAFSKFYKKIQNEKGCLIFKIRSDHGGEFKHLALETFCEENDFNLEFSTLITQQKDRVV